MWDSQCQCRSIIRAACPLLCRLRSCQLAAWPGCIQEAVLRGRPEQHEPASTALKRVRAPPGFSQAPQDETRPLQDVLAQLQLPEQRAHKELACSRSANAAAPQPATGRAHALAAQCPSQARTSCASARQQFPST